MMYDNINQIMFMLCLSMIGAFIYCLHAENSYVKGDLFNKYIPIMGIIMSIIASVLIICIECRVF